MEAKGAGRRTLVIVYAFNEALARSREPEVRERFRNARAWGGPAELLEAKMRARRRRIAICAGLATVVFGGMLFYAYGRSLWVPAYLRLAGKRRTVEGVVTTFGPAAEARLKPHFDAAGVPYPPARAALLGFKQEKRLELWADRGGAWAHIHAYPILGASGNSGPKLRAGDRQVPEGLYSVVSLNPNSSFHLSLKIDYPNAFDRRKAREDGRTHPGDNIFIHGSTGSVGCLAMGNEAIEELFMLAARTGVTNVRVILAPRDLRGGSASPAPSGPAWLPELYEQMLRALEPYKAARSG